METGKHKGDFQIRIQPINKITGKRESWPVQYASTKREAKSIERQMYADYENGFQLADGNTVFYEAFNKYVESLEPKLSPVTYREWYRTGKVVKEYFNRTKIKDVNQRVMENFARDYVNDKGLTVSSSSVISKRLGHVRKYFKTIVGTVVKNNPVPEGYLKLFFSSREFSKRKEFYLFSDAELSMLKTCLMNDLNRLNVTAWGSRLAIWIALETGMRTGEIQALRFDNLIKEDNHYVFKINDSWVDSSKVFNGSLKSRSKGDYRYCLPMSKELVSYIEEYKLKQQKFLELNGLKNSSGLIFLNIHDYKNCFKNIPMTQRSLNEMLLKLCQKLGIEAGSKQLSMYSFRHTLCTKLANTPGMSYPWATERMGNSLPVFMKNYVKADRDINSQMIDNWMLRTDNAHGAAQI